MSERTQTLERGGTFYGGTPTDAAAHAGLLGKKFIFNDHMPPSGSGIPTLRSGFHVTCMLVQNVSGAAILPKELCMLKNDGTIADFARVISKSVAGAQAAGEFCFPADEFLPAAGVADDDFFYIVVNGPAKMITDTGGDTNIALGAYLKHGATTAGRVIDAGGTEDAGAIAFAMEAVNGTSTDIVGYVLQRI